MNVEFLNVIEKKDLFSDYDFAAICLRLDPAGPTTIPSLTVRAMLDGEKIGERVFTSDDAWLRRFRELDLEWTKLSEPAPEAPYDVTEKLAAGESVFLVVEPHMNFLDCTKDLPENLDPYEFEIEVILETSDGPQSIWGDWDLPNPWLNG